MAARDRRRAASNPSVLAVVFVGGCVGGYARYALTQAWTTSHDGFPWAVLTVNVVGAFVLAVVIAVAETKATPYLRPLLGTGFCGAFTTFSSITVAVAQLLAHHRPGTAGAYLALTIVLSLAAAWVALVGTRAFVHRVPDRGEQPA
jgi:CrcB protein